MPVEIRKIRDSAWRGAFLLPNDAQRQVFIDKCYPAIDCVIAFNRVIINGRVYHSLLTTEQKKDCGSCVLYSTLVEVG